MFQNIFVLLQMAPAGDHVPSVERSIQTIKNHIRTIIHSLPFKYYPTLLLEGCVYNAVRLLNILPSKNGISTSLSPTTLVTGKPPPKYNDLVKPNFGDYEQVYVGTKTNMESQTVGGIAIGPSGNVQHSWYFLSLETGKKLHSNQWTILPMDQREVDRVNELGILQKQKPINTSGFEYSWRPDGPAIDDIDSADDSLPVDTAQGAGDDDDPSLPKHEAQLRLIKDSLK